MTTKHHVVRVEIGSEPTMPDGCRLILEDGSELVGLTSLRAEAPEEFSIPTWKAEGLICAGKGVNGEPVPLVRTPGTEDQP